MFLTQTDYNGNVLWTASPSRYFNGFFVRKDASGNFYVAGNFNGGATITTASGDVKLQSYAGDVFLAKLDANGQLTWIKQSNSSYAAYISGLELDKNGNPVISGHFSKQLRFASDSFTSRGNEDIFIARYDASGNFSWVKQIGGTDMDALSGMRAIPSGMMILYGIYNTNAYFDKQPAPHAMGSMGFITEVDPSDGAFHWIKTDPNVFLNLVSTADQQHYYANVAFRGKLTAGSQSISTTASLAAAVIKMDTAFNRLSVYQCGALPSCMAVQQNGALVMGGSFENSINLAGKTYTSYGESDIYMLSYDSTGNALWTLQSGGPNIDDLSCIQLGHDGGTMFISGTVQSGPAKFGTVSIPGNLSGTGFMLAMEAPKVSLNAELSDKPALKMYPNPAQGSVNIESAIAGMAAVYDMQGRLLKMFSLAAGINALDIPELKKGIYLLKIATGNTVQTEKLQVL